MKKERFTNLSQRIEENYPEMENEMLMELRQKDEKYVGIHKRFYDLQKQHLANCVPSCKMRRLRDCS